jgi:hypothetical protein
MVGQRFAQSALAEHKRLVRKRQKLEAKRDQLNEEIGIVEGQEAAIRPFVAEETDDGKLRGRSVRDVAVAVLARERGPGPIHYREWLELLEREGFEVAGRRPESVFHNQVRRHPAVHSSTQRGVFVLASSDSPRAA